MVIPSLSVSPSSSSHSPRQHDTRELINRFIIQLSQGCGISTCSTPLCATARARSISRPVRSYTAISARAIAVVLAASEDAHRRICPHLSSHMPTLLTPPQERLDPKSLVQQLFNTAAALDFHSLDNPAHSNMSADIENSSFSSVSAPISCHELTTLWNATRTAHANAPASEQDSIPELDHAISRLTCAFSDFTCLSQSLFDDPMAIWENPTHQSTIYCVRLDYALRYWTVHTFGRFTPSLIFDSFWEALEPIFDSPFAPRSHGSKKARIISSKEEDSKVVSVIYRSIHALTSSIPRAQRETWHVVWSTVVNGRAYGKQREMQDDLLFSPWLRILDAFEQESALRMAKRLIRAIGARTCLEETLTACGANDADADPELIAWSTSCRVRQSIIDLLIQEEQSVRRAKFKTKWRDELRHGREILGTTSLVWLEWLRKCFLKEWDGKLRINRWTVAGSALELIEDLWKCRNRGQLDMPDELFMTPVVSSLLDVDKTVQDWMSYKADPNMRHLLSFKFLFNTKAATMFVRTAHHISMRRAYGQADSTWQLRRRAPLEMNLQDEVYLDRRLRAAQDYYLVLKINRHSILPDAFDQLWHREKQELLRPLRVRMGIEEGEIGHDLGGVQIEFFKLACQEAFGPEYSLFNIDPQTRFAWFQPATMVPLYKYQLLGVLFGLAIYNGITLPVSFPLAFYKKLLFQPCDEIDLAEGWPSLAKSLQQLRSYPGSVEEDFVRDYVFSFSANGLHLDVSMDDPWNGWTIWDKIKMNKSLSLGRMNVMRSYTDKHHPPSSSATEPAKFEDETEHTSESQSEHNPQAENSEKVEALKEPSQSNFQWPGWTVSIAPPDEEPQLVTNDNRHEYIQSYAKWVMDWSIRPQFNAFTKGIYAVLSLRPLTLLTAEQLRTLVEGHNHLDIHALQKATTYTYYTASHPVITWFWQVVTSYPQSKQKKLLEFVTASSRVPVNGAESLVFVIGRSDAGAEALPGSSTCFGTLRLPEYQSLEVLREKLDIALEHSLGFGQA